MLLIESIKLMIPLNTQKMISSFDSYFLDFVQLLFDFNGILDNADLEVGFLAYVSFLSLL